jgi:thiamine pyrophosphokinase
LEAPKPLTAFIFANGSTDDGPFVQRELATAADAWVIAADGGALQAQYYGRPVNTVIGDLDSLDAEELTLLKEQGADIHQFPPEKNETDLELAILFAAQNNFQRIRVFSALGGRLDQTLSNIYLLALPALRNLDVRLLAGKQQAWLIYPGISTLNGEKGDTISLIPIAGEAHGIRTHNLYYPLLDETLRFGPARGVSNVMQTETATVSFTEGVLLVVHTLGRA